MSDRPWRTTPSEPWPQRRPRQKRRGSPQSHLEDRLARWIEREGLPRSVQQFRFAAPDRQWRFDFAWPELGIAVEIEGGEFVHGRHNRGGALTLDAEKYNAAAQRGWFVFRVTTKMFGTGEAFETVKRALTQRIAYVPTVLTGLE